MSYQLYYVVTDYITIPQLDPTTWLGVGGYVVGFLIDGGLVGVTDGRKPLTKRAWDGQNGEPDRLGRVLKVSAARSGSAGPARPNIRS
jgi:hypothetical protein